MPGWLMRAARGLKRGLRRVLGLARSEPASRPIPGVEPAGVPVTEACAVPTHPPVPIFLYHCIGDYQNDYHRTADDLRKDLATLYARGYRCVPVQDILHNRLDLTQTPKPFGLRFDDNTEDQFRLVNVDGNQTPEAIQIEDIDKDTAIGILERFRAQHPDSGRGGIFFLCRHRFQADGALFGQPELQKIKLWYLLDKGYELGNHTFGHEYLSSLTVQQMQETIAKCDTLLEGFIGERISDVRSFAYPFADVPADPEKLAIVAERFDYSFANVAGPLLYPCAEGQSYLIPRVTVLRQFDMPAFLDEIEAREQQTDTEIPASS